MGPGRRRPLVDPTPVAVPLETGPDAGRGGGSNDDGSRSRGYQVAPWRILGDQAGLSTQGGRCPLHGHAWPLGRLWCEPAPVLRAGDWLWEDRGFGDGATSPLRKRQRHVEVMVPLQANRWSSQEAGPLAARHDAGPPHPSRDPHPMAFVHGGEPLWDAWKGSLHAGVMREWPRTKNAWNPIVLGTTDHQRKGPGIVRHDAERRERAHDYAPMQRGGWQRKQRRATRDREIVLYLLTVLLSDRLSPLFATTQTGARVADKTRQALAFEPRRSRRTPGMAAAGGYVEICATLRFASFILPRPASAQGRWRHWLDEHFHTVQKRA